MLRRRLVYINFGAAADPTSRSCGPTQKASGPADGRTGILPCLQAAWLLRMAERQQARRCKRFGSGFEWRSMVGGCRAGADSPAA